MPSQTWWTANGRSTWARFRLTPAKRGSIAEMYARACYSMLLLSSRGPALLRIPVSFASSLPISRALAIHLGRALLSNLPRLVPQNVNQQLLLTSALMGMFDVVLDESAFLGKAAVLRIASLVTSHAPSALQSAEQQIVALTRMIRLNETRWQSNYWESVLVPAVQSCCLAEALAVTQAPDPAGMAHRRAGIDCAFKGMWYVIGPSLGLDGDPPHLCETDWHREQRWMADTSLLMQIIDDWVDQDEDRGTRITPVLTGDWNLQSVEKLYRKTALDQSTMLAGNGIRGQIPQQLFLDLYHDYIHVALNAMSTGTAS